jgi:hypothetical protein
MVIIVVIEAEGGAKRCPQLTDLGRVPLFAITPAGQVSIAERRACQKVLSDGFFSRLLPRDVDQEGLERSSIGMPSADIEESPVGRSSVRPCAFRKRGFRFKDGLEVGSQFTLLLTALKRPAGGDGRIKVHDVYGLCQDNDS